MNSSGSDDGRSEKSWQLISDHGFDSDSESLRSFVIVETPEILVDTLVDDDSVLDLNSVATINSKDSNSRSFQSHKCSVRVSNNDQIESYFFAKEERIFRGHTYRKSSYINYLNEMGSSKITCGRDTQRFEDGSAEVAISLPDQLFHCSKGLFGKDISLNRDGRFEALINMLEEDAIEKREIINRKYDTIETVYSVPVIGHHLITPIATDNDYAYTPLDFQSASNRIKLKKVDVSTIMVYCGKEYDMNYYYLYTPLGKNPLQQLGLLKPPIPDMISNNPNIYKLDYTAKNLTKKSFKSSAHLNYLGGNQRYGQGWQQENETSYLQIDLGRFQYITHIGTAGLYPNLRNFPTRKLTNSYRTKKRWRWPKKSANDVKAFVHIIESMDDVAWVTHYNVYYCTAGKQWKFIGNFEGNKDSITENVHSMFYHFNTGEGLYTRYLRIQPTGHFNKPILRLAIYGDKRNTSKDSSMTSSESTIIDIPDCVEFTISRSRSRLNNKYQDGLFPAYKDEWLLGEYVGNRQKRKSDMRNFIKHCRDDDLDYA